MARRYKRKERVTRPCAECGSPFSTARADGRFCSARCRKVAWKKEHIHIHRDELRAKLLNVLETLEVSQ